MFSQFASFLGNIVVNLPLPALIFSVIVIFAPMDFISFIGLVKFRTDEGLRLTIGIVFIASFALLVAGLGKNVWPRYKENRNRLKFLINLTDNELRFLRPYIDGKVRTRQSHPSGLAMGLVQKDIIFISRELYGHNEVDYNMTDWAYDHLMKNPEIFDPLKIEQAEKQ